MSNYMRSSYLEIRNISHRYGQKVALQSVTLSAGKSEILALLGPSGSGKSTLLASIAGIVKPHAGEILVGGRNLLGLLPEARGLGMVFQDYALWPHMRGRAGATGGGKEQAQGGRGGSGFVGRRTDRARARPGRALQFP